MILIKVWYSLTRADLWPLWHSVPPPERTTGSLVVQLKRGLYLSYQQSSKSIICLPYLIIWNPPICHLVAYSYKSFKRDHSKKFKHRRWVEYLENNPLHLLQQKKRYLRYQNQLCHCSHRHFERVGLKPGRWECERRFSPVPFVGCI